MGEYLVGTDEVESVKVGVEMIENFEGLESHFEKILRCCV